MSEQALAAIVKRALGRLEAELKAMEEDDRGFERTRSEAATFYSKRSHALAMASHIQGLYSQAENLLKQVTEQLGDEPSAGLRAERTPRSARQHAVAEPASSLGDKLVS